MKLFLVFVILALTSADHGGPHHDSAGYASVQPLIRTTENGYGTPVYAVPVRFDNLAPAYSAPIVRTPENEYGAPGYATAVRFDNPAPAFSAPIVRTLDVTYGAPVEAEVLKAEGTYSAPPVLKAETTYAAPEVLKTEDTYSAPPVLKAETTYAAPEVLKTEATYSAPPVLKAETTYTAPAAGYGGSIRTEELQAPSADIAYNFAWTAPIYQRLVHEKTTGYATAEKYDAPVEGYGPASPPTATYGAPLIGQEAPRSEYGAPETTFVASEVATPAELRLIGEGNAYVRFQQHIDGGYGTRTVDAHGNTDESYEDANGRYSYEYGVDATNGDIKRAEETSEGGNVRGSYSFLQPDGCTRTVRYMTDEWGFKAVVEYRGPGCAERYDL